MKKSISPVIALIILIVIAVSLAAASYVFVTNLLKTQMQSTERQMETITNVGLLEIVGAYYIGPKIAIYDYESDNFPWSWGAYSPHTIYKWLQDCEYGAFLINSDAIEDIDQFNIFILPSGESFPVSGKSDGFDPNVNYIKILQDYVLHGGNLVLIGAWPLFYPSYYNKTTGLWVSSLWCSASYLKNTTINGISVTYCDRNGDNKPDYPDFQCVEYTYNPKSNIYLCNRNLICKPSGPYDCGSSITKLYFGLDFWCNVLYICQGTPTTATDLYNGVKSPAAKILFPSSPDLSNPEVLRPMHIWNNPSNPFLGKINLIHLWNDTLGTSTTMNSNASHITIAIYPGGGKIFHIAGSYIDQLGKERFICQLIHVLLDYKLSNNPLDIKELRKPQKYPITMILYNPTTHPIQLNNTYYKISGFQSCIGKLIYNKTFISDDNSSIIYPGKQKVIHIVPKCYGNYICLTSARNEVCKSLK